MRFPSVIICIFIAAFAGKTFMEVQLELLIVNYPYTIMTVHFINYPFLLNSCVFFGIFLPKRSISSIS